MDFRICGLPFEPFAPIFEMSENELSDHGSVRRVAPPSSIYPCRVSLRHAQPGETVIPSSPIAITSSKNDATFAGSAVLNSVALMIVRNPRRFASLIAATARS